MTYRYSDACTSAYEAEAETLVAYPPKMYSRFAALTADAEAIVCSEWWVDRFPTAPVQLEVRKRSGNACSLGGRLGDVGAGII